MTTAAVTGAVDFSTYDGSLRWWTATRLRLVVVRRLTSERVLTVDALRSALFQSMTDAGIGPAERQDFAIQAVQRLRANVMPWLPTEDSQNRSDPLDVIAQWYATFAPDALKRSNG
jgi:hypothetical protein